MLFLSVSDKFILPSKSDTLSALSSMISSQLPLNSFLTAMPQGRADWSPALNPKTMEAAMYLG